VLHLIRKMRFAGEQSSVSAIAAGFGHSLRARTVRAS
jgi:hypothetical protein